MKQATSVIPIVFTLDADPVGRGLVASLARPGGNVTGLSTQSTELVGKRLELLREIIPDFRRLAIMTNVNFLGSAQEVAEIRTGARAARRRHRRHAGSPQARGHHARLRHA